MARLSDLTIVPSTVSPLDAEVRAMALAIRVRLAAALSLGDLAVDGVAASPAVGRLLEEHLGLLAEAAREDWGGGGVPRTAAQRAFLVMYEGSPAERRRAAILDHGADDKLTRAARVGRRLAQLRAETRDVMRPAFGVSQAAAGGGETLALDDARSAEWIDWTKSGGRRRARERREARDHLGAAVWSGTVYAPIEGLPLAGPGGKKKAPAMDGLYDGLKASDRETQVRMRATMAMAVDASANIVPLITQMTRAYDTVAVEDAVDLIRAETPVGDRNEEWDWRAVASAVGADLFTQRKYSLIDTTRYGQIRQPILYVSSTELPKKITVWHEQAAKAKAGDVASEKYRDYRSDYLYSDAGIGFLPEGTHAPYSWEYARRCAMAGDAHFLDRFMVLADYWTHVDARESLGGSTDLSPGASVVTRTRPFAGSVWEERRHQDADAVLAYSKGHVLALDLGDDDEHAFYSQVALGQRALDWYQLDRALFSGADARFRPGFATRPGDYLTAMTLASYPPRAAAPSTGRAMHHSLLRPVQTRPSWLTQLKRKPWVKTVLDRVPLTTHRWRLVLAMAVSASTPWLWMLDGHGFSTAYTGVLYMQWAMSMLAVASYVTALVTPELPAGVQQRMPESFRTHATGEAPARGLLEQGVEFLKSVVSIKLSEPLPPRPVLDGVLRRTTAMLDKLLPWNAADVDALATRLGEPLSDYGRTTLLTGTDEEKFAFLDRFAAPGSAVRTEIDGIRAVARAATLGGLFNVSHIAEYAYAMRTYVTDHEPPFAVASDLIVEAYPAVPPTEPQPPPTLDQAAAIEALTQKELPTGRATPLPGRDANSAYVLMHALIKRFVGIELSDPERALLALETQERVAGSPQLEALRRKLTQTTALGAVWAWLRAGQGTEALENVAVGAGKATVQAMWDPSHVLIAPVDAVRGVAFLANTSLWAIVSSRAVLTGPSLLGYHRAIAAPLEWIGALAVNLRDYDWSPLVTSASAAALAMRWALDMGLSISDQVGWLTFVSTVAGGITFWAISAADDRRRRVIARAASTRDPHAPGARSAILGSFLARCLLPAIFAPALPLVALVYAPSIQVVSAIYYWAIQPLLELLGELAKAGGAEATAWTTLTAATKHALADLSTDSMIGFLTAHHVVLIAGTLLAVYLSRRAIRAIIRVLGQALLQAPVALLRGVRDATLQLAHTVRDIWHNNAFSTAFTPPAEFAYLEALLTRTHVVHAATTRSRPRAPDLGPRVGGRAAPLRWRTDLVGVVRTLGDDLGAAWEAIAAEAAGAEPQWDWPLDEARLERPAAQRPVPAELDIGPAL